jgi:hypothetical protein
MGGYGFQGGRGMLTIICEYNKHEGSSRDGPVYLGTSVTARARVLGFEGV